MLLLKAKKPTYFVGTVILLIIIFWLKLGGIKKSSVSTVEVPTLSVSKPSPIQQSTAIGSDAQKVKVTVYYETLCPDSIGFIVRQLQPVYNTLGSIMDVDLVPYGKASYKSNGDSWDFQCQHGKRECHGNKIHSCVIELYPNISQWMPFIFCSMSSSDPVGSSDSCAIRNSLDWSKISACADGKLGSKLLQANGVRTESLSPRLVFVPWILVNDQYSDAQLEASLDNFMRVVCDAYKGSKPQECLV